MRYTFEAFDAENFLSPNVFFVGASFGDGEGGYEDQIPDFISRGVWVNGWGSEKEKFLTRCNLIKKGDVLVIKRMTGRGSSMMAILALGIVVGINEQKEGEFFVEWSMPRINPEGLQIPLLEVGTISRNYSIDQISSLSVHIRDLVTKARTRFLRWNLNIVRTTY